MLSNLSYDQIIWMTAFAASLVVSYVLYIASYLTKKRHIDELALIAKAEGRELPSYEIDRVNSYWLGYLAALIIQLVIGTLIGWAALQIVSENLTLGWWTGPAVAAWAAVVGSLIVDKYLIHPIVDGKFYQTVEKGLLESFLAPDKTDPMSDESVRRLVEMLSEVLKK